MQKWEYKYLLVHFDSKGTIIEDVGSFEDKRHREVAPYLDYLGNMGWEAITILGNTRPEAIFLKRPKSN